MQFGNPRVKIFFLDSMAGMDVVINILDIAESVYAERTGSIGKFMIPLAHKIIEDTVKADIRPSVLGFLSSLDRVAGNQIYESVSEGKAKKLQEFLSKR